jgi:predicted 2-oxoglutarate/Fe(II)-dependent dioxygenase YbiX
VPRAEFFRNFNLFVRSEFLVRSACEDLIAEIRARPLDKARLSSGLDENVRRARESALPGTHGDSMWAKFRQLKPEIERHFGLALEDSEPPRFLSYGPGDFFVPHFDSNTSPGEPDFIQRRRISVVVFLNGTRNDLPENDFEGGDLMLYGLMKEPEWVNCGLPVTPEPGLLIGFPSATGHEVRPVTSGRRFSIASWYYSASATG